MARVFKRNGTYWIDFNDAEGRRRRINTKVTNKRVATDVLNDKLTKVVKRQHLGVIDDTDAPFADFADLLGGHPKTGHRPTAENRPTEYEPVGTISGYSIAPSEGKAFRCGRLAADARCDPYRGMGRVEIVAPGASLEAEFDAESTFRYLT